MNLPDQLLVQAKACEDLGSPFMGRMMRLLADGLAPDGRAAKAIFDFVENRPDPHEVIGLRLAGALHALVLTGTSPALVAVYPPNSVDDHKLLSTILREMEAHADHVITWLASAPQTNEIRRSNALLPGIGLIAAQTGLPLMLSEPGASGGINLMLDQFHYSFEERTWGPDDSPVRLKPDWSGSLPDLPELLISERRGCDLAPVDLLDPEHQLLLMSYTWPDQTARMARLRAAFDIGKIHRPQVDQADVLPWLKQRLDAQPEGMTHVIFHSVFWQYLGEAGRADMRAAIETAGQQATASRPLAWLRLEADGAAPGAGLDLQIWPSGEARKLARASFHGDWVEWTG